MDLSINMQKARDLTRRHFFGQAGMGFGAIALQQLLARNGVYSKLYAINYGLSSDGAAVSEDGGTIQVPADSA